MKDGFIRIGASSPKVKIANCRENRATLVAAARAAAEAGVRVLAFPELSLTGASLGDLYLDSTLLAAAERELGEYVRETADLDMISFVGLPIAASGRIYNCVAGISRGEIVGISAKHTLPRHHAGIFTPAVCECGEEIFARICGAVLPINTDCLFECEDMPELAISLDIGEDAALPTPPSSIAAEVGASVIINPCAPHEAIGLTERRRLMANAQSARLMGGYLTVCAGEGESGTDGVTSGAAVICECGKLLAERAPFSDETLTYTEIDLGRIVSERRRAPRADDLSHDTRAMWKAGFSLSPSETALSRKVDRHPFIPAPDARDERCSLVLSIQARGLAGRITAAHSAGSVLGISGGLDSTLAILVAVRAAALLGRSPNTVTAITMPGFGTSERTKSNAEVLCEELGVTFRHIPINDAVRGHFADIGHDEANRNVVYENAQARERTQILMDIANAEGKLVVGTGDLSELALGFATYNGDHMSMYGVNASVPKTLLRSVIAYEADKYEESGRATVARVLRDILDTPVSPELLPPDENGEIAQQTEGLLGPYELHDFFLYYLVRFGFAPEKILRLARAAFGEDYSEEEIRTRLALFLRRFFTSQFKRSCLPDGPAVGRVSLSPRAAWRMPSDADFTEWLDANK